MKLRALWRAAYRGVSAALSRRLRFVFLSVAAALVVAAAGFLHLSSDHVARATSDFRSAEMIVFLEHGVSDRDREKVSAVLGSLGAAREVRYVSSEEAMARSESLLGGEPLLAGIEPNFFPASFEVSLAGGAAEVAEVHPLIAEIQGASGVDSVEFLGDWIGRIDGAVAGARRVSTTAADVAGLLAVVVLIALVRVASFSRRTQSVMIAVGSSRLLARVPEISAGALFGACSGALAVGLIALAHRLLAAGVDGALGELFGVPSMQFLGTGQLVLIVVACAAAGALGGTIGVERGARAV